jgi:hypothetical protein
MSNFSLQISFLMLEPHSLKQRLLVLLQVLTPAKPPVTNRSQSTPCKIRNREIYHKNCQQYIYNTKIPTTETQPPRELTANWRKQRENGSPPLANSAVPYPPLQSQKERKIRTVPPPTPPKCPNKIVSARHSTQKKDTRARYIHDPARQRNSHGPSTPN